MDRDRRYSEDEVAEILERATEARAVEHRSSDAPDPSDGEGGMTLAELHDIASEVGISSELITRAAAEVGRASPVALPESTFLGETIAVGRTTYLPRSLTDSEWNLLVTDLRETFGARGTIRQEGAFRHWTNGNLQALLEPTADGERLRLRTRKGSARPYLGFGAAMLVAAPVMYAMSLVTSVGVSLPELFFLGAMGAGLFGGTKLTLPRWVRTRQRQMEEIIERLTRTIDPPGTD